MLNELSTQILLKGMQPLETFRGSDDQDVTSWLTYLEELFDAAEQKSEERLTLVPMYLADDAKQWYRIHRPYSSWSDFKHALVYTFTSSTPQLKTSTQLYNRSQALNESVPTSYFGVMLTPADIFRNSMMIGFDDAYSVEDDPFHENFLLNHPLLHSQHICLIIQQIRNVKMS
jgi:hypothetical protein